MVGVEGLALTAADRERLGHPLVGGVILFAANFHDREQLCALCSAVHEIREPRLLVAVDQEGGRVQRFRDGFTRLPPMRRLGELRDRDPDTARQAARAAGITIAAELIACGVDLSLAPVLDIDHGASTIIGDRALHSDPAAVADLAGALIAGLREAGMASVGKHYPGHGAIRADSHLELPVDERPLDEISACDLVPFRRLARELAGIMPAHVLYPAVDSRPSGFSRRWLGEILRGDLGFEGTIFSDDLGMEGAAGEGTMAERARAAVDAGCDMVLACTAAGADRLLDSWRWPAPRVSRERLAAMRPRPSFASFESWRRDRRYLAAQEALARLGT